VQVVALGTERRRSSRVAVPGDPKLAPGEMATVDELTAQPWERDGRWGLAFRCVAIHSATGRVRVS
jgi:hypothetical protein